MSLLDFPIIIDDAIPENNIYMMPTEIFDLIQQARDGLISWDYVIAEVTEAAQDGRIVILKADIA